MCWRLGCPFRRLGHSNSQVFGDDITKILIFGVSGMTGGALMDAALSCAWFKITGFTRAATGDVYEELSAKGIDVVTGDMNDISTLPNVMHNIDCVFLNTNFWEHLDTDKEYEQGYNVTNAAMLAGVKHLIYVGTDYSILTAQDRCKYLEGKSKVENYIVSVGMPYTIVRLGFYYENFLSIFKPHQTGRNEFAIALPMGRVPLNMGSVSDFGHCIVKIALRPGTYVFQTLNLSTTCLTVDEMVDVFNENIPGLKFYNPRIPLSAYNKFEFPGAEEIATMFAHYRTVPEWDKTVASDLNSYNKPFGTWLKDSTRAIMETILDKTGEMPLSGTSSEPWRHGFKEKLIDFAKASLTLPAKLVFNSDHQKVKMAREAADVQSVRTKLLNKAICSIYKDTIKDESHIDQEIEVSHKVTKAFLKINIDRTLNTEI